MELVYVNVGTERVKITVERDPRNLEYFLPPPVLGSCVYTLLSQPDARQVISHPEALHTAGLEGIILGCGC